MTPSKALARLVALRTDLSAAAEPEKLALLAQLEHATLPRPRDVLTLHEQLSFARAYPSSPELLALVERMLAGFAARRDLARHRRHLEDTGITGTTIRYRFFWPIARWLAARTDAIVGVSEGVRRSLLALGMPEGRTLAIDNGIRLEPFAEGDRPHAQRARQVVMAARFARQKDHATLIRAAARLRARGLVLPVLLAGGGKPGLRRQAEALVRSLGLADQVRFLGQHGDMPGLLTGSTLHVLSTLYEGMPLALVEAMAAGCAVAGSAVPGVRELLREGVDGRLFAQGDDAALAAILEGWGHAPAQAEALGRAARLRARTDFDLARTTARYEALFESLCAAAP